MTSRISHLVGILVLGALLAVSAGCASNKKLEEVRAIAEQAQQTADEAMSRADEANRRTMETDQKVDEMFKKTMQK